MSGSACKVQQRSPRRRSCFLQPENGGRVRARTYLERGSPGVETNGVDLAEGNGPRDFTHLPSTLQEQDATADFLTPLKEEPVRRQIQKPPEPTTGLVPVLAFDGITDEFPGSQLPTSCFEFQRDALQVGYLREELRRAGINGVKGFLDVGPGVHKTALKRFQSALYAGDALRKDAGIFTAQGRANLFELLTHLRQTGGQLEVLALG
jgi:hypothetical protein